MRRVQGAVWARPWRKWRCGNHQHHSSQTPQQWRCPRRQPERGVLHATPTRRNIAASGRRFGAPRNPSGAGHTTDTHRLLLLAGGGAKAASLLPRRHRASATARRLRAPRRLSYGRGPCRVAGQGGLLRGAAGCRRGRGRHRVRPVVRGERAGRCERARCSAPRRCGGRVVRLQCGAQCSRCPCRVACRCSHQGALERCRQRPGPPNGGSRLRPPCARRCARQRVALAPPSPGETHCDRMRSLTRARCARCWPRAALA